MQHVFYLTGLVNYEEIILASCIIIKTLKADSGAYIMVAL